MENVQCLQLLYFELALSSFHRHKTVELEKSTFLKHKNKKLVHRNASPFPSSLDWFLQLYILHTARWTQPVKTRIYVCNFIARTERRNQLDYSRPAAKSHALHAESIIVFCLQSMQIITHEKRESRVTHSCSFWVRASVGASSQQSPWRLHSRSHMQFRSFQSVSSGSRRGVRAAGADASCSPCWHVSRPSHGSSSAGGDSATSMAPPTAASITRATTAALMTLSSENKINKMVKIKNTIFATCWSTLKIFKSVVLFCLFKDCLNISCKFCFKFLLLRGILNLFCARKKIKYNIRLYIALDALSYFYSTLTIFVCIYIVKATINIINQLPLLEAEIMCIALIKSLVIRPWSFDQILALAC